MRAPLATLIPGNFRDQLGLAQPRFDAPLAFFVLAAATLCALLCAAIPGLPGSGGRDPGLLRDGSRSAGPGRRVSHALSGLVAGEVALAVTLLSGAALFALHFWKLERRDLGIRPKEVLTLQLALPGNDDGERRSALVAEILAAVRSVPGVSPPGRRPSTRSREEPGSRRSKSKGSPPPTRDRSSSPTTGRSPPASRLPSG
jgi:putative ABC transport system permease protein